jgi:hypothetical protein
MENEEKLKDIDEKNFSKQITALSIYIRKV